MFSINDDNKWMLFLKLMVFGLTLGIIIFMVFNRKIDSYEEIGFQDYIYDSILSVRPYQSVALIELNSGKKIKILPARNYEYKPYKLNYFLSVDDYLEKRSGNDTLVIKRGNRQFIFRIGEYLNEELRED